MGQKANGDSALIVRALWNVDCTIVYAEKSESEPPFARNRAVSTLGMRANLRIVFPSGIFATDMISLIILRRQSRFEAMRPCVSLATDRIGSVGLRQIPWAWNKPRRSNNSANCRDRNQHPNSHRYRHVHHCASFFVWLAHWITPCSAEPDRVL